MKKTILLVLALLGIIATTIAQVNPTKAEVAYYMPRTSIIVDVEYEEIHQTQGMFYQYSERYLGTKDVVTETGTRYAIKHISIATKATADPTRVYTFTPSKAVIGSFLLTKDGILEGVNIEAEHLEKTDKKGHTSKADKQSSVAPFMEEQLLAGSTAKMAESVAKQIYRIREARLNLVSGDVDKMPADGKAMKLALDELRAEEDALVALFVGTKEVKVKHERISFNLSNNPADLYDMSNEVFFRFSQYNGVVGADDLSGEPYYLNIEAINTPKAPAPDKKAVAASPIYYNIPGSAQVTLSDGENVIAEKVVAVAQYGYAVPLPAELIKAGATIRFDTKTGALVSIE